MWKNECFLKMKVGNKILNIFIDANEYVNIILLKNPCWHILLCARWKSAVITERFFFVMQTYSMILYTFKITFANDIVVSVVCAAQERKRQRSQQTSFNYASLFIYCHVIQLFFLVHSFHRFVGLLWMFRVFLFWFVCKWNNRFHVDCELIRRMKKRNVFEMKINCNVSFIFCFVVMNSNTRTRFCYLMLVLFFFFDNLYLLYSFNQLFLNVDFLKCVLNFIISRTNGSSSFFSQKSKKKNSNNNENCEQCCSLNINRNWVGNSFDTTFNDLQAIEDTINITTVKKIVL